MPRFIPGENSVAVDTSNATTAVISREDIEAAVAMGTVPYGRSNWENVRSVDTVTVAVTPDGMVDYIAQIDAQYNQLTPAYDRHDPRDPSRHAPHAVPQFTTQFAPVGDFGASAIHGYFPKKAAKVGASTSTAPKVEKDFDKNLEKAVEVMNHIYKKIIENYTKATDPKLPYATEAQELLNHLYSGGVIFDYGVVEHICLGLTNSQTVVDLNVYFLNRKAIDAWNRFEGAYRSVPKTPRLSNPYGPLQHHGAINGSLVAAVRFNCSKPIDDPFDGFVNQKTLYNNVYKHQNFAYDPFLGKLEYHSALSNRVIAPWNAMRNTQESIFSSQNAINKMFDYCHTNGHLFSKIDFGAIKGSVQYYFDKRNQKVNRLKRHLVSLGLSEEAIEGIANGAAEEQSDGVSLRSFTLSDFDNSIEPNSVTDEPDWTDDYESFDDEEENGN